MQSRQFQFYIVPTPIGNIRDITLRAIDTLKNVDLIACEDTRVTQKLLNHYNITTKCISYHKYNERERVNFFLNELKEGKSIALVSDAGTPMICDPGNVIIEALRKENIAITALPGASAVTTFLSQITRCGEEFTFIGFIPRGEKQIQETVKKYSSNNFIFYDSPERILKTLKIIQNIRGDIKISLGRELSKLFEEIITDSISCVLKHFENGIKGEIVCMVYAANNNSSIELDFKVQELRTKGFKAKEIAVILSTLYNLNKNDIYKQVLELIGS